MKRKKDQKVFDLIKSLSQSEKRYISINIDKYKGKSKIYKLFFDEILKLKEYDEDLIKSKILKEISFSQFHVVKNYLFNTILKLLGNYHQERTQKGIVNSFLFESDYLFKKGLISESIKRLKKAKGIAYKYEFFHLLIDILRRELKYYVSDYKIKKNTSTPDELFTEEKKVLAILKNISALNQLSVELYMKISDSAISKQELTNYASKIIKSPLLVKKFVAFCNQIVQNHILAEAHVILLNHKESYKYNQLQIELFEKNPHQKLFLTSFYYPVLFNFIYKNIYLNEYEIAENLLNNLIITVNTNDENLHIDLKYRYFHLKAFLFIKQSVFNENLSNEIESFCLVKQTSLNNSSYMLLLLSNIALKMNTNKVNLTKIARIIMQIDYALIKEETHKKILLILTYVIQDELGNVDIRNKYAEIFVKKNEPIYNSLTNLEKGFYILFTEKKLSEKRKKEIKIYLNNYKTKNNNLNPDNIYNYFNYEDWLLKKIS